MRIGKRIAMVTNILALVKKKTRFLLFIPKTKTKSLDEKENCDKK